MHYKWSILNGLLTKIFLFWNSRGRREKKSWILKSLIRTTSFLLVFTRFSFYLSRLFLSWTKCLEFVEEAGNIRSGGEGVNSFWRGFTIFGSIVLLFTSFFENLPSRCYVIPPLTPPSTDNKLFYNITESLHSRCWESLLVFEILISYHALFLFFFVYFSFIFPFHLLSLKVVFELE